MDVQKVDMFIMANSANLPSERLPFLRERMLQMDDDKWGMIASQSLVNPTTALIISFFLGAFGVDRLYIGDTGLGILKLLTCGGVGLWALIDLFLIMGATKDKNYEKLLPYLG